MKKMIPTFVAALFAVSFGAVQAQEVSGITISTDPARAEAVEKKAEEIRARNQMRREARQQFREKRLERKSHVAKAHQKAEINPATREARQQQREKRLERKAHVAKAHKKARGDAVEVVPNTENRQ